MLLSPRAQAATRVVAVTLFLAAPLAAGDWPQHRGRDGSGVATDAHLFAAGPFTLEVVWKRPLGSAYSGVSIAGGLAVTAAAVGDENVVAALDARTGEPRWQATLGPVYRGHDGSHDGPVSTPAVGDGRVHALDPRGRLATFDLASGRELWSLDLAARDGAVTPTYGFGVSPVLAGGTLVVAAGGKPSILGLDPATGAVRWAAGEDRFTYQTPLAGDGGTVLVGGNTLVFALDTASGRILWQHEHGGGFAVGAASLTPIRGGDGAVFLKHSSDDSKLIHPVPEGDGVRFEERWSAPSIRGTYATPVLWDGSLYGYAGRFLTAVDWATGASRWRSREPGDGFLAAADGHLVVVTKEGGVHVGAASPDGWTEEAGLHVFADFVWTAPSIADGAIFVRSLGEVARLEARPVGASAAVATPAVEPSAGAGDDAVSRFLRALEAAPAAERPARIDAFLAAHPRRPIVEGDTVHFLYRGEGADVAIEADVLVTGEDVPMTRVAGSDLFHASARLEPDARTAYVFHVDLDRRVPDPANPRVDGDDPEQKVSWMAMPAWREPAYLAAIDAPLAGRVETHELAADPKREEKRVVDVYLPPGYDADADRRYPVLVVHDGEEARAQGRLDRAFDAAIRSGAAAPFLAVFVHPLNGGELYRGRDAYLAELASSVLPWLDGAYRTVASPAGRTSYAAGGASAIALHAAWTAEPLFAGAALQSPFLLTRDEDAVVASLRSRAERPLVLYFDWGRYDWRSEAENWNTADASRRLDARLREAGYRPGGGEVPEGPGWWAWRSRLEPLLRSFFPPG